MSRSPDDRAEYPAVDPDVDLHDPAERREFAEPGRIRLLGTIALGGILGAEARWGLSLAWPHDPGGWPWATMLTNAGGCALIGVLMVVITERVRPHPLVRPFLGVGVLGGFTTFSTYAVDAVTAATTGHLPLAVAYVGATPAVAVLGVTLGVLGSRAALPGRPA